MKEYALPASLFAVAFALLAVVFLSNSNSAVGSVGYGQEYSVTEISTGSTTIYNLPGTIGSVVVNDSSSAAGFINFYATTSQATSSADLVFGFDTQAAEGTYTYDVAVSGGILVDVEGTNDGSVEVTHRR